MAVSKVILNGTTLMDVTQKTVTAANMLNGITALKNDGTDITGTYVAPTFSTQSKTVSPTTSQQTVSPDTGYDGRSSVTVNAMPTGSAGTPSATKGTVSNNSVTVTPSVTNTTGYITGGTKTGTAVTVSASELVSGTKSISIAENGTITENVANYANAEITVNVSGGGGGDGMIHLYTDSSFSNAYIDSGMTTSVLESYDYDIIAAFAALTAQPVLIHFGDGEKASLMIHIDHDPIDATLDICFFKSYAQQTSSYQTISCS